MRFGAFPVEDNLVPQLLKFYSQQEILHDYAVPEKFARRGLDLFEIEPLG